MNRYIYEKGFSLVEVIISIAMVGILIVPILSLMGVNAKLNSESRKQLIATNLAESEIEELKFSKTINLGKSIFYKEGFRIETSTESIYNVELKGIKQDIVNSNKLYKIIVEVKKDDKTIEKLLTYKNSLKGSDFD